MSFFGDFWSLYEQPQTVVALNENDQQEMDIISPEVLREIVKNTVNEPELA